MSKRVKVALLYGGNSGEHEVSLASAASVLSNLDATRFEVIPIGMDKQGRCYVNDYEALLACQSALPVCTSNARPIDSLIESGRFAIDVDVVFPVVHGPLYEDGCLQGMLKLANVAFVGCDVLSSAIGMDKDMARRVTKLEGIASARYRRFVGSMSHEVLESFAREVSVAFGFPMFVKPCSMGSSVGIHRVNNLVELQEAICDARKYDDEVLVEEFIAGREIELAVLENAMSEAPHVSCAGEIKVRHRDGFYSYAAKYLESEQTDLVAPAVMSDSILQQLQQLAAKIFTCLKCRGMARVDFFVNEETGAIYFNEINTLPGFTAISMYPRLWQVDGLPYSVLLEKLVTLAINHHQRRQQLVTHYQ